MLLQLLQMTDSDMLSIPLENRQAMIALRDQLIMKKRNAMY
jgi:hypothetical protein